MTQACNPPPPDLLAGLRSAAEAELRPLLAAHPATALLATATLAPVAGGLGNFAWRADAGGRSHFIRLARPGTEALGADHASEQRILELASAAGLAPRILYSHGEARLLVMEWIDAGVDLPPWPTTHAMATVARALALLHGLAVPRDLRVVDFGRQARELEDELAPTSRCPRLHEVAAAVFGTLQVESARRVLCHHDLDPLNLLFDRAGRLWLVDWEYAGLGDPAFDLASYSSQHGLHARQRARFAASYAAAGGATVPMARLERARWAFDYVQWLWYRVALQGRDTLADPGLGQARARRLAASLRGRASRVLRCNNESFAD